MINSAPTPLHPSLFSPSHALFFRSQGLPPLYLGTLKETTASKATLLLCQRKILFSFLGVFCPGSFGAALVLRHLKKRQGSLGLSFSYLTERYSLTLRSFSWSERLPPLCTTPEKRQGSLGVPISRKIIFDRVKLLYTMQCYFWQTLVRKKGRYKGMFWGKWAQLARL